jgi:hypothetical protein
MLDNINSVTHRIAVSNKCSVVENENI